MGAGASPSDPSAVFSRRRSMDASARSRCGERARRANADTPSALAILSRRDEDAFDPIFDHLLVLDRGEPSDGRRWRRSKVVGTYRVLRQEIADLHDGFYTQGEYDVASLIQGKPDCKFVE